MTIKIGFIYLAEILEFYPDLARKYMKLLIEYKDSKIRKEVLNVNQAYDEFEYTINGGNSSSSGINVNKYKDPAVRRLARQMCKLIKAQPPKDTAFYDHIVEEAKRRNWQSKRWEKEREQMIRYGKTHVKSECQPKKKTE